MKGINLIIDSEIPTDINDLAILHKISEVLRWYNVNTLTGEKSKAIKMLLDIDHVRSGNDGNLCVDFGMKRFKIIVN